MHSVCQLVSLSVGQLVSCQLVSWSVVSWSVGQLSVGQLVSYQLVSWSVGQLSVGKTDDEIRSLRGFTMVKVLLQQLVVGDLLCS